MPEVREDSTDLPIALRILKRNGGAGQEPSRRTEDPALDCEAMLSIWMSRFLG